MARRILVPVLPSERFYDAVVAAGDLVAEEGGLITFLFTTTRPPPLGEEKVESQTESELEVPPDRGDAEELEAWREGMIAGLGEARDLLAERGVGDEQVDVAFGDTELPPAEAIAEEAAAGAYDLVVLARGYFVNLPEMPGEEPRDIAAAIGALADDGVRLLVT